MNSWQWHPTTRLRRPRTRTSILHTALAVALVVGTSCKDPAAIDTNTDSHLVLARGVNVVPVAADTTPRGSATFNTSTLAWTYSVAVAPAGTINSVALYEVAAGAAL